MLFNMAPVERVLGLRHGSSVLWKDVEKIIDEMKQRSGLSTGIG